MAKLLDSLDTQTRSRVALLLGALGLGLAVAALLYPDRTGLQAASTLLIGLASGAVLPTGSGRPAA